MTFIAMDPLPGACRAAGDDTGGCRNTRVDAAGIGEGEGIHWFDCTALNERIFLPIFVPIK
jgi:hypothetical protein